MIQMRTMLEQKAPKEIQLSDHCCYLPNSHLGTLAGLNIKLENTVAIGVENIEDIHVPGAPDPEKIKSMRRRFACIRASVLKTGGLDKPDVSIINYGPVARSRATLSKTAWVYGIQMPQLEKGLVSSKKANVQAYETILTLLLYAVSNGVRQLFIPIFGVENHWGPLRMGALIWKAVDHLAALLKKQGSDLKVPMVYLQGSGRFPGLGKAQLWRERDQVLSGIHQELASPQGTHVGQVSLFNEFGGEQKEEQSDRWQQVINNLKKAPKKMLLQYQANFFWDQITVRLPAIDDKGKLIFKDRRIEVEYLPVNAQLKAFKSDNPVNFIKQVCERYRDAFANFFHGRWNHSVFNRKRASVLLALLPKPGQDLGILISEELVRLINNIEQNPVGAWRVGLAAMMRKIEPRQLPRLLFADGSFKLELKDRPAPSAPSFSGGGGGN